jgi:hypothetical protein
VPFQLLREQMIGAKMPIEEGLLLEDYVAGLRAFFVAA